MGIDRLSNYDAAATFLKNTEEGARQVAEIRKSVGTTTVPMVQKAPQDENTVPMGLGVERTANSQVDEQPAEQVAPENAEGRRLVTKQDRKELTTEITEAYQENGVEGMEELPEQKEARRMAKDYVKNEERIENSDHTVTFLDKKACEQAKKEQQAREKQLRKELKDQGLSKNEIKQRIRAQHIEYRYIGNKNTQRFINEHPELFCDENGNYSPDKARETARLWCNTNSVEGEAENGYLSLQERRQIAEQYGVKDDVIADIVKNTGHGFEKDNTPGYRILYVAGSTVLGAGVGALVGGASRTRAKAVANSESGVVAPGAGVIAGAADTAIAEAGVRQWGAGAISGAAAGLVGGLLTMKNIRDNGSEERRIYNPAQPQQPVEPPVEPPVTPQPPVEPRCELEPQDVPVPPTVTPEQTCIYNLQKGQSLYDAVRDGYGLTKHEDIMRFVHEIKDRYGIPYNVYTARTEWEMPEIEGRTFKCDVDVNGTVTKYAPGNKRGVNGEFERRYDTTEHDPLYYTVDCDGNRTRYDSKDKRDAAVRASKQ